MLVRATLNPCPAPHGCGRPAGGATPSTLLVWDTRPCPQVSFQTLLLPRASDALHSLLRADDPSLSESVLPSQTPLVCPSPALTDETADQLSLSAEGREPGGQGIRWRDCTWPLSQARRGVRWHWHSRSFLGRLPGTAGVDRGRGWSLPGPRWVHLIPAAPGTWLSRTPLRRSLQSSSGCGEGHHSQTLRTGSPHPRPVLRSRVSDVLCLQPSVCSEFSQHP